MNRAKSSIPSSSCGLHLLISGVSLALFGTALSGELKANDLGNQATPVFSLPLQRDLYQTNNVILTNWYRNAVFYQLYLRSFYDSDGDGNGDIKGLIRKLDYLNDGKDNPKTSLGIKGLWLMPVQSSPWMDAGYDCNDFLKIQPAYGTMASFKKLILECHKRHIKVITDLVLNHISSNHLWFKEAQKGPANPYFDYFIWTNRVPEGWGKPWGGGSPQDVWSYSKANNLYYYSVFGAFQPDLNFRNPKVITALSNVVNFYLSIGIDGFRVDAIRYYFENGPKGAADQPETHQYVRDLHTQLSRFPGDRILVGEAWTSPDIIKTYFGNGSNEVQISFDFDFFQGVRAAVCDQNAFPIYGSLKKSQGIFPFGASDGIFLSNHDMKRWFTSIGADVEKAKLSALILLTMPGVPFVYYGEEIGMINAGVFTYERNSERLPFQWTAGRNAGFTSAAQPWAPVAPNYVSNNVATMSRDEHSLLNYYRKLIFIRNHHQALGDGQFVQITNTNSLNPRNLLSYSRYDNRERLLVLINLASKPMADIELNLAPAYFRNGEVRDLLDGSPFPPLTGNTYRVPLLKPGEGRILLLR